MPQPMHSQTLTSTWESPSNLAIVKYWGKRESQIPENPSISMTLSRAVTTTKVTLTPHKGGGFSFRLNQLEHPSFRPKIERFLTHTRTFLPHMADFFLAIDSHNSFPHSSGIASSASSMSALALCLTDLEGQLSGKRTIDLRQASMLARLGSGSAARSIYGGWNLWGEMESVEESSDLYAIPIPIKPAPVFAHFHDDILIISSRPKSISSSEGHRLMQHHPYKEGRRQQAAQNAESLMTILKSGDIEGFIKLTETEALSLHALMMSSTPSYTLLHPNTLEAIQRVRSYREKSGIPLCFSLDAGPNLHILYPHQHADTIKPWMAEALFPLCESQRVIADQIGPGPRKISEVLSPKAKRREDNKTT